MTLRFILLFGNFFWKFYQDFKIFKSYWKFTSKYNTIIYEKFARCNLSFKMKKYCTKDLASEFSRIEELADKQMGVLIV